MGRASEAFRNLDNVLKDNPLKDDKPKVVRRTRGEPRLRADRRDAIELLTQLAGEPPALEVGSLIWRDVELLVTDAHPSAIQAGLGRHDSLELLGTRELRHTTLIIMPAFYGGPPVKEGTAVLRHRTEPGHRGGVVLRMAYGIKPAPGWFLVGAERKLFPLVVVTGVRRLPPTWAALEVTKIVRREDKPTFYLTKVSDTPMDALYDAYHAKVSADYDKLVTRSIR